MTIVETEWKGCILGGREEQVEVFEVWKAGWGAGERAEGDGGGPGDLEGEGQGGWERRSESGWWGKRLWKR